MIRFAQNTDISMCFGENQNGNLPETEALALHLGKNSLFNDI